MSILELGSGLGLFGMTMLKMGHSFTFTDCHHAVLNFLLANSKINFDEVRNRKVVLTNKFRGLNLILLFPIILLSLLFISPPTNSPSWKLKISIIG